VLALALGGCASLPGRAPLFVGIDYSRMPAVAEDMLQAIHVLRIDLRQPGIALEVTAGDRSAGREFRAQTTSEFLVRGGMSAAVNGGFFSPFKGGSFGGEDYYPRAGDPVDVLGLSMHAGKVDSAPEADPKRINGTVCIRKPATVSIVRGQGCPPGTDEAMAAGPLLLANGSPQAHTLSLTARHPRTAFGLSADRKTAWMVVVDGRQPLWSAGATLPELAEIFRRLGAADALNLDGGGSSAMVISGDGAARVLNSPVHVGIPGLERPSANHLGVRVPDAR
jgi:exopolysaccharide biosynthesis protein